MASGARLNFALNKREAFYFQPPGTFFLPALFLRRAHALTRTPLPPWERALTGLLMAASVIQTAVGCTGSVVGIVRAWGGYGAPFACHVGED